MALIKKKTFRDFLLTGKSKNVLLMVFETGNLVPLTAVKSAEGVWVESGLTQELLDKNEPLMFSLLPTSGKKAPD